MTGDHKLSCSYLNRSAFTRKRRDYFVSIKDVIQAARCHEIMLYNSNKYNNFWGGTVAITPLYKNFNHHPYQKIVAKNKRKGQFKFKEEYPTANNKTNDVVLPGQKYHKCCYCGKDIIFKSQLTKDHLVPLIKGGNNKVINKRYCCYACNQEKGQMLMDEYREYLLKLTLGVITKKIANVIALCEYTKQMGNRLYGSGLTEEELVEKQALVNKIMATPVGDPIDYIPGRIYK